jgi:transcriptional regulator with XRE-family HTH domain
MSQLGTNVRNWRKINGLTTELAAERAGVSRDTLRAIETGQSTSSANLFAVLRVLGVLDAVVASTNPLTTDFGAQNFDRTAAERVRIAGERRTQS